MRTGTAGVFLWPPPTPGPSARPAQRLGISQPAVSAAVRSLENELSSPLLKRGNSGVSLTPLGRLTYRDARAHSGTRAEHSGQRQGCGGRRLAGRVRAAAALLSSDERHRAALQEAASENQRLRAQRAQCGTSLPTSGAGRSNIAGPRWSAWGLKIREQARGMGCEIVPLYADERKMFHRRRASAGRQGPKLTPEDLKRPAHRPTTRTARITCLRAIAPYFGGEYRLANRDDILDLVIRNEAVFIQAAAMFQHDYRVREGHDGGQKHSPEGSQPQRPHRGHPHAGNLAGGKAVLGIPHRKLFQGDCPNGLRSPFDCLPRASDRDFY